MSSTTIVAQSLACCRLHCLLLQQSRGAILDFAFKLCYVCQKDEHLRIQGTMPWPCCRLHCTSRSVFPKTARRATSSLSELFACIRPVANAAANRRRGSGISVSGPTFQDQKLVATAACPSVKHDDSGKGATSSRLLHWQSGSSSPFSSESGSSRSRKFASAFSVL